MLVHRLALVLAAAVLAAPVAPSADDRRPVPAKKAQDEAQDLIRSLFKKEYAGTKASDRAALAAKLLKQGLETTDDPTAQFVLFRESRDLAARGADALGLVRAAEEMTAAFALKPGEAILPAVEVVARASGTQATARTNVEILMSAADEVRLAGEWDNALAILREAGGALQRAASPPLSSRLRDKFRELEAIKAEADHVKDSIAALKSNPDDPAANLAVGRFKCLYLQDWDAGLPLLTKGSDEKLKAATLLDLRATRGTDEDQIAAGDAWYDLADSASGTSKTGLQIRAHHWYVATVAKQTGITKTRLEKRIGELEPAAASNADRTRMWIAIRRGVLDGKNLKREQIIGGAFANKTFEEIPPRGAILVGFNYTVRDGGRFPGVIQPIFRSAHGEVLGEIYGVAGRGERGMNVRAKPGYAVGAIYTRGGGLLDAFKPIFMRITDHGLDPKDSYEGPHVGGMGGNVATLGGDGSFIVGLHGKVGDKGKMEAMSPVLLLVREKEE